MMNEYRHYQTWVVNGLLWSIIKHAEMIYNEFTPDYNDLPDFVKSTTPAIYTIVTDFVNLS